MKKPTTKPTPAPLPPGSILSDPRPVTLDLLKAERSSLIQAQTNASYQIEQTKANYNKITGALNVITDMIYRWEPPTPKGKK